MAGNLYLPDALDRNAKNSALVIGHSMGAVKEQAANLYATKMAAQGFVTISVDLPSYGGSEGQTRQNVLPDLYAEAFSAAVDYLGLQSFIDWTCIGAIGICGSGSFVLSAAKIGPRISAIATSSMHDMGAVNRNGLEESVSVKQRKETISQMAEQRWGEAAGADVEHSLGTPLEITNVSTPIDREFYDFYHTSRGEVTPAGSTPNITAGYSVTSGSKFMNFYPFNDIETSCRDSCLSSTVSVDDSNPRSRNAVGQSRLTDFSSGIDETDTSWQYLGTSLSLCKIHHANHRFHILDTSHPRRPHHYRQVWNIAAFLLNANGEVTPLAIVTHISP